MFPREARIGGVYEEKKISERDAISKLQFMLQLCNLMGREYNSPSYYLRVAIIGLLRDKVCSFPFARDCDRILEEDS